MSLREEILDKVKQYYKEEFKKSEFVPGQNVIPFAGRIFDEDELVNLVDSSLDFWLTAGRYADQFEKKFAEFMNVRYCLLTNSGSSANLLAFSALTSSKLGDKRIVPGDEVITVAAGFPTTVNPIIQNRCVPVFVDVDLETYNINIQGMKNALTHKTKAVMIAHTLGNPFNLDEVVKFCKENGLYLIEDCCDAVGSTYNGQKVGTFGDISTVSFYPAHHMTMGEGGAVLTNNPLLKTIIQSFRDWGRDCYCGPGEDNTCGRRFEKQYGELPVGYDHKYVYSHIGYNLKVTDMQAAVGLAQLDKLSSFIDSRKENYKLLYKSLLKFNDYLILPIPEINSDPAWFGFPITVKENNSFTKNDIVKYLELNKIMTRQLFAGNMVKQPAYLNEKFRVSGSLINTDIVMNSTFFIGVYPGIDMMRLEYIIEKFTEFFEKI